MSDEIALSPYDPEWALMFDAARDELAAILEPAPMRIEHMGSTSVPGLMAKPVVDIIVLVADMAPVEGQTSDLASLGYGYRPEVSNHERLFFRRFGADGVRTHHLHIHTDSIDVGRTLLFRDLLRANAGLASDYVRLKQELAARYRDDREAYSRGKDGFIDAVIASAGGPPRKPFWNK